MGLDDSCRKSDWSPITRCVYAQLRCHSPLTLGFHFVIMARNNVGEGAIELCINIGYPGNLVLSRRSERATIASPQHKANTWNIPVVAFSPPNKPEISTEQRPTRKHSTVYSKQEKSDSPLRICLSLKACGRTWCFGRDGIWAQLFLRSPRLPTFCLFVVTWFVPPAMDGYGGDRPSRQWRVVWTWVLPPLSGFRSDSSCQSYLLRF